MMGVTMVITALLMMAGELVGHFAIKASSGFANDMRKDLFNRIQKFSFKILINIIQDH